MIGSSSRRTSLLAQFHYLDRAAVISGAGFRRGDARGLRGGLEQPRRAAQGPDIEPPAIAWLRSYSNFLTPKLGLTSADFWSALAIILRNLILNWLVILPVFCLALLALTGFAIAVAWFAQFDPQTCGPWFFAAAAAGCISLFLALHFTTRNRPTRGSSSAGQTAFLRRDLAPAVLSGIFFTFALASPCASVYVHEAPMPAFLGSGCRSSWSNLGGLVIYLQLGRRVAQMARLEGRRRRPRCVAVAGAVYGAPWRSGLPLSRSMASDFGLQAERGSADRVRRSWALTSQLVAR